MFQLFGVYLSSMSWSICCHHMILTKIFSFCERTLFKNIPSLLKFWFEKMRNILLNPTVFYFLFFYLAYDMICSTFSCERLIENICLKLQSIKLYLLTSKCVEKLRYNFIAFAKLISIYTIFFLEVTNMLNVLLPSYLNINYI